MGPLVGMENFERKYFDVFLNFYSRQRLIYTNVFMYYYAEYLTTIENGSAKIDKNKGNVSFYFIEKFLNILNYDINL